MKTSAVSSSEKKVALAWHKNHGTVTIFYERFELIIMAFF